MNQKLIALACAVVLGVSLSGVAANTVSAQTATDVTLCAKEEQSTSQGEFIPCCYVV